MKRKINNAVGPQAHGRDSQTASKALIPVLALLSLVGGLQASTQMFAQSFHFHESLGANLNHVYLPWGILRWAGLWYSQYPDAFMRSGSIGMLVTGVGLILLVVSKMFISNSSKMNAFLHGSARWADMHDIREAGLLPPKRSLLQSVWAPEHEASSGVYVGAYLDKSGTMHYLRHNGPEHILCYAPTRSGKGVGLVVPTLLSWPHSTVVTDLKGELWAMTAGWRKKYAKNKVIRFEPAALSGSAAWNPLDEIRLGNECEVGDVQNIATLIVDPDGKGLETHWQKTSQALLVGLILHALYTAKNAGRTATLSSVDAILSAPSRDIGLLWKEMTMYCHLNGQVHPVVSSAARDMMDRPMEEAGSVLSTAKSYLALYRDPVVARNTSKSEFCIKDLMHDDDPVSLYIITQPNDSARLRPLVRVMLNMIVRLLADKMEFERVTDEQPLKHKIMGRLGLHDGQQASYLRTKKTYKHRLLAMIDEFPSLGKLEILQQSLAFLAGYGIKFYLICQDLNQLKSRETGYGPDETITSNCHVQNAFPPNRIETAEHLSKLTGQTTIVKEQITTSGRRTSALLGQVSRTSQEVQRALLTPDECLRMPGPKKDSEGQITEAGDMVVYVAGFPAIYGRQPLYFQDPTFIARAAVPEPAQSDKLRSGYEQEIAITI